MPRARPNQSVRWSEAEPRSLGFPGRLEAEFFHSIAHLIAVDPEQLEVADPRLDEREATAKDDLRARLVEAIAQLNPRAVEMIILRYEHDTSEAEIGRLLGTSRAVVAVTLFRARARLKKLLKP